MIQAQAEKEDKLVETILEMNKSFYCDLCDKQYFKYSEYDNHLNSYDHHHRQVRKREGGRETERNKDWKEGGEERKKWRWESGWREGGSWEKEKGGGGGGENG